MTRKRKDRNVADASCERVLVVPTAVFHRLGHFQGFTRDVDHYLGELLDPRNVSFRSRSEVERDPSFKQLIPYMIFVHGGGPSRSVFVYTRGTGMGEGRLHRKRSVGVGGHIAAEDTNGEGRGDPFAEGMRRELDEEVILATPYTSRCVGLLNDDETDVGRVHLGLVHLFEVERPAVAAREPDIIESGFQPIEAILADLEGFETWSRISLRALFGANQPGDPPAPDPHLSPRPARGRIS
ncbi:MAG: phosphoesterase [Pirellulales bacterium]|nr:phosphoesterase [Pirellulales bacterium]